MHRKIMIIEGTEDQVVSEVGHRNLHPAAIGGTLTALVAVLAACSSGANGSEANTPIANMPNTDENPAYRITAFPTVAERYFSNTPNLPDGLTTAAPTETPIPTSTPASTPVPIVTPEVEDFVSELDPEKYSLAKELFIAASKMGSFEPYMSDELIFLFPSNKALATADQNFLDELLSNPDRLKAFIGKYVAYGSLSALPSVSAVNGMRFYTVNGNVAEVSVDDNYKVYINGIPYTGDLVNTGRFTSLGIDGLLPDNENQSEGEQLSCDDTSKLSAADLLGCIPKLQVADIAFDLAIASGGRLAELVKDGGQFTMFLPSDDAFTKLDPGKLDEYTENPDLLTSLLEGLTIEGEMEGLTSGTFQSLIESSFQIAQNQAGSFSLNGVSIEPHYYLGDSVTLYVLDGIPESNEKGDISSPAIEQQTQDSPIKRESETCNEGQSIEKALMCAKQFEILLLAMSLASMSEELRGENLFTVLAPTDAAFASLTKDELDALLDPDSDKLRTTIWSHIIPGNIRPASITDGMTVTTVSGKKLTFVVSPEDGSITVDGIRLRHLTEAGNGTLYSLDDVILTDMSSSR